MPYRREHAKLPMIHSQGPMPPAAWFKYKDQVLVRFKSGWYTLGTIIEQKNHWNLGEEKLKYLYYRDVRHSHCLLLGGQGCTCPPRGGHKPGCKLVESGIRAPQAPVTGIPAAVQALTTLPTQAGGHLIVINGAVGVYPAANVPPAVAQKMPTIPWTGTGKPRRKPWQWRKLP